MAGSRKQKQPQNVMSGHVCQNWRSGLRVLCNALLAHVTPQPIIQQGHTPVHMFSYDTSFVFSHGIQTLTVLKTCQENALQLIHSDKRLVTCDRYKEHPAEHSVQLWKRLQIRRFQIVTWGVLSAHCGPILCRKTPCDSQAESHENLWNASDLHYEYGVLEICENFSTLCPGLLTWSFSECP